MNERLIFWHFFHQIEKDLSYERWIEKYKLFELALMNGHIPFDEEYVAFRKFCKILYLQDYRDEPRFDDLLTKAIQEEKTILNALLQKQAIKTAAELDPKEKEANESTKPSSTGSKTPPSTPPTDETDGKKEVAAPSDLTQSKFFHPNLDAVPDGFTDNHPKSEQYLHGDEYFAVTRRQMVKAWQYLRRSEKRGFNDRLDIQGTIRQIAQNGLFLEPVFHSGKANREDTILIYADCRGSMTPFHEFTRRLIDTARGAGGHPKAPVYYFQNFPVGYVFQEPNLNNPIKVKESLLKANRQATLAIIISDAGAARGNTDVERNQKRLETTQIFLSYLRESVAHIIWLNPVPEHRWVGTAAALIRQEVTVMAPVFDHDGQDFQSTIRLLLKQKR